MHISGDRTIFMDSGTIVGTINEPNCTGTKLFQIPEIVITGSSSNNLNQNQNQSHIIQTTDKEISKTTSTACSEGEFCMDENIKPTKPNDDDFEKFVLNRTHSENNILDVSVASELQFQPSICSDSGHSTIYGNITSSGQQPAQQVSGSDQLNTSLCSHESRQSRRQRYKNKVKAKCSPTSNTNATVGVTYPARYTAIFMGPQQHTNGNVMVTNSPNPATTDATRLLQGHEYAYIQHSPLVNTNSRNNQRNIFEPNQPSVAAVNARPATIATRLNLCKWFSRPSLPLVIGIFALGGIACTLGGIVLGSTGLIDHSTQYLSAALLMIGIGVSLLVIAGAIWRISLPDVFENCHCYRHMDTCINCNNPYCLNRMTTNAYFYPEFQYRTPPPSYLTSLNEYAAMSFLLHPNNTTHQPVTGYNTLRMNTPPPMYRSTNSLSMCISNYTGPLTIANTTGSTEPSTSSNTVPITPKPRFSTQSQHSLNIIAENIPPLTQPVTKESNYLDLD